MEEKLLGMNLRRGKQGQGEGSDGLGERGVKMGTQRE